MQGNTHSFNAFLDNLTSIKDPGTRKELLEEVKTALSEVTITSTGQKHKGATDDPPQEGEKNTPSEAIAKVEAAISAVEQELNSANNSSNTL